MEPVDPTVEQFPPVPAADLAGLPDDWLMECIRRADPGSIEELYRRDPDGCLAYLDVVAAAGEVGAALAALLRPRIVALTTPPAST